MGAVRGITATHLMICRDEKSRSCQIASLPTLVGLGQRILIIPERADD